MADYKTILSQNEIDALVSFLQDHQNTPIGTVLDQTSIDKLIELIRFNNNRGIFFGKEITETIVSGRVITKQDGSAVDPESCSLKCEIEDNGFMRVYCVENTMGSRYRITPTCVEHKEYIEDNAEWGYAISPKILTEISNIFKIGYDSDTLKFVKESFAKVMFGNPDAEIPGYYLN